MVLRSESRAGTRISLIIIHTNEGGHKAGMADDHTAEDLAAYLDRANAAGDYKSYHKICDDDSTVNYVPDDQAAWSALAANKRSLNICLTGWAHWGPADWQAHRPMLVRAATEVRQWCAKYGIPARKLTPAQVGTDQSGICGHWDWTLGKKDGTHTDPGQQYLWDWFIQQVVGKKTREAGEMVRLPATPMPDNLDSDPRTWVQRNFDVPWNITGGWEGGAAFSFGVQDFAGRRVDAARGYLKLASWIMPGGVLVPVNDGLGLKGSGLILAAHLLTPEYAAPPGCVGVTVNYAAPGEAYVAIGRSG